MSLCLISLSSLIYHHGSMVTYLTFPVIAEALDTLMIIDQRPRFRQYDIH